MKIIYILLISVLSKAKISSHMLKYSVDMPIQNFTNILMCAYLCYQNLWLSVVATFALLFFIFINH